MFRSSEAHIWMNQFMQIAKTVKQTDRQTLYIRKFKEKSYYRNWNIHSKNMMKFKEYITHKKSSKWNFNNENEHFLPLSTPPK